MKLWTRYMYCFYFIIEAAFFFSEKYNWFLNTTIVIVHIKVSTTHKANLDWSIWVQHLMEDATIIAVATHFIFLHNPGFWFNCRVYLANLNSLSKTNRHSIRLAETVWNLSRTSATSRRPATAQLASFILFSKLWMTLVRLSFSSGWPEMTSFDNPIVHSSVWQEII